MGSMFCADCLSSFQVVRNIEFHSVICLVSSTLILTHVAESLEEISFFVRKSLLLVLHSRSPVIHGHRFLRTLFSLSGACLSTQLRNISFHSLSPRHLARIQIVCTVNVTLHAMNSNNKLVLRILPAFLVTSPLY